jgi:adenosine deaminase
VNFRSLPKLDLHLHLDGAVRPSTLAALARDAGLAWPPDGEERCRVPASCRSLAEFLRTFEFFLPALGSARALRRAARELCEAQHADGVIYFEARFCPGLWLDAGLSPDDAVAGALDGLREGAAATGVRWGLILCGSRTHDPRVTAAAVRLARERARDGVVGVDIAGDERFPASPHASAFAEARRAGVPITMHAGEAGPAANVREAMEMGAVRIGHGVRAGDDPAVLAEARRRGVTFEMCLTSNLQTCSVARVEDHPFRHFLREGVRVTLNTDDPGVQGSTLSQDYELAERAFGLAPADFRRILLNSVEASFAPPGVRAELRRRVEEAWR